MKYLGKRYLHKFLKAEGFCSPVLKHMDYGKYRGDEWLKDEFIDIFCFLGNVIFVSELAYDEKRDKFIEISRYRYDLVDGEKWIKTYERKTNG